MKTIDIDAVSEGSSADVALLSVRDALLHEIEVGSVFALVQGVLDRIGPIDRIGRLRIWGHGAPGLIAVGNVPSTIQSVADLSLVDTSKLIAAVNNQLLNGSALVAFRNRFAPRGWVELHACRVAAGAEGERLLTLLADAWRVPVLGGDVDQLVGRGLEGTRVVARPGGLLQRHAHP